MTDFNNPDPTIDRAPEFAAPNFAAPPAVSDLPEVEAVLLRLRHMIAGARDMPLSASSVINKDDVLGLIDELGSKLPEEIRAARWLLKEREEFLARTQREGDEILDAARSQSAALVQRTEVVKAAELRARHILDDAESEARQMRHGADDYCDQKLGSFEIVLQKTLGEVGAGRAKLRGNPMAGLATEMPTDPSQPQFGDDVYLDSPSTQRLSAVDTGINQEFFDQDL